MTRVLVFALAFFSFLSSSSSAAPQSDSSGPDDQGTFSVEFDDAGVTSLKRVDDKFDTDYIAPHRTLGHVQVRYRVGDGAWQDFSTADSSVTRRQLTSDTEPGGERELVTSVVGDDGSPLETVERFRAEPDSLYWRIHFRNTGDSDLALGDVLLPTPFNTSKRWDKTISYTQRVEQHSFISGHGSFLYWMRPNSVGPYLVMTPVGTSPEFEPPEVRDAMAPAKLEYSGRGGVYLLSGLTGAEDRDRGGNWRQPQTSVTLSPHESVAYAFRFRWADGYDGVRQVLYEEGLFDVHVAPGMTVPKGLDARVALRSQSSIQSVAAEFPAQTQMVNLGNQDNGFETYQIRFAKLGENKVTVHFGDDQYMVLEFFVTEPLETLIKKRSSFLVSRHQHRDPDKWYNGLFSEWDMRNKVLRSPDDTDGMHGYMVAADDPGLCKAPFIAGKNIDYPDPKEIEAVEYYLQNYVWGGLQRTDEEEYPYAIYGIPNWKVNRDSGPTDRDGWEKHFWRPFDYTHVVFLYWNMYRVAKFYPELVHYLDEEGYLERAFGTAKAYYTVPEEVGDWPVHEIGHYDELIIPDLITELYDVGWDEKADWLREQWENKVRHFVEERPNLFWSEYPFDPTGFESHHAFARYAAESEDNQYADLEIPRDEALDFMREEIAGNVATRGWLETSFHQLGVERSMRYTAQMGGWGILDYALYYADDPFPYLRLGYASLLSSWALMNSGTPETNYGYWYPGKENDGGAGSAFVGQAWGRTWAGKSQPRGPWNYSAEIDLGFGAALRTAATIVADDPLFGTIVYGGEIQAPGAILRVVPRDGLGRRLHVMRTNQRFHLILNRDGFAAGQPIEFNETLSEIAFTLENRDPTPGKEHEAAMRLSGLPAGSYEVSLNGEPLDEFSGGTDEHTVFVPMSGPEPVKLVIRKTGT